MAEDLKPLPVSGCTSQSQANIDLVNEFKQDEERLLRKLDAIQAEVLADAKSRPDGMLFERWMKDFPPPYDEVWLWEARRLLQGGFMALNRAIFQPQRIDLPEDKLMPLKASIQNNSEPQ